MKEKRQTNMFRQDVRRLLFSVRRAMEALPFQSLNASKTSLENALSNLL